MTFTQETEQTAPGHTVTASKGETALPGKQEVHRPWHGLQQWASMTLHFSTVWSLAGLALPSHWLWKEVTKEWITSSPSFTITGAATCSHWGSSAWAHQAGGKRLQNSHTKNPVLSELKRWIHTSIITWPEGDFQNKSSKTPNQTRIPHHSSHKEIHQLDLLIQDFFEQFYRANIFKACTFYRDYFRVTVLFSTYCICKYKSINLVHSTIGRYYTFQLKDNVRIKLQSLTVWNHYIFLNLKLLL